MSHPSLLQAPGRPSADRTAPGRWLGGPPPRLSFRAGLLGVAALLAGCKSIKTELVWPDTGTSSYDPEADEDGDGYPAATDCDDYDANIHPDADELCDGKDNDCDGAFDEEAVDARTFYADTDLDGYGDAELTSLSCERSPGFVAEGTDCNDSDEDINPGVAEVCNDGVDNDCNGDDFECLRTGQLGLRDSDFVFTGVATNDQAGIDATIVGDMDGDGFAEVAVGAWRSDARGTDSGAVYIVSGGWLQSEEVVDSVVSLADIPTVLDGTSTGHNAGNSMASAGDVNADGYADLVVGAFHAKGGGNDSGEAYIVLGPNSGASILTDASARLIGEYAYDVAGGWVSGGTDLTGNGRSDVLIGAVGFGDGGSQGQGALYVVEGNTSGSASLSSARAVIEGTERYDRVGASAAAGDLDGDGVGDVVAGAETAPGGDANGHAAVFFGPLAGRVSTETADATYVGEGENHNAGKALGVADVDGDGYGDLVIGAPGYQTGSSPEGAVYVVPGPPGSGEISLATASTRIVGDQPGDQLGASVAADGDMTGDGRADIWLGAPGNDQAATNAGAAGVFYGPVSGSMSFSDGDFRVFGEAVEDSAGTAVSGSGDVNGDGVLDLVISAPSSDRSASEAGAAFLVFGTGL